MKHRYAQMLPNGSDDPVKVPTFVKTLVDKERAKGKKDWEIPNILEENFRNGMYDKHIVWENVQGLKKAGIDLSMYPQL